MTPGVIINRTNVQYTGVSDHWIFSAEVVFDPRKKRGKGRFKINAKVHETDDFSAAIEELVQNEQAKPLYRSDPAKWGKGLKSKVARTYRNQAIIRSQTLQREQKR